MKERGREGEIERDSGRWSVSDPSEEIPHSVYRPPVYHPSGVM